MPRVTLVFCLLSTLFGNPVKTLFCIDGIDCDYGCGECEGVACLKIIRPAISSGMPGHLGQHESIARTCLPYDTRSNLDLEPAGCRTNMANGQKICICYNGDYCNAASSLSAFRIRLQIAFLLAIVFIIR